VLVGTVEQAAAWVDEVGIALLFPNGDFVLPSLWEAVEGTPVVEWAVRGEDGKQHFTPSMEKVWTWKDELPRRRLACVGLHVARTSSLVAPKLVGAVYALTGRSGVLDDFRGELEGLELAVAEAVLDLGRPTTRRELRLLVSADKRQTDKAVNALQRKLVLTNGGVSETENAWASTLHDLFARRWKARLKRVPPRDEAVATLAEAVVHAAGEASIADVAAVLKLRRREAATVLDELEARGAIVARRTDDLTLFSPARARAAAARGSSARSRAAGSRSSPRRSP
jgi:hypothetical protein